MYVLGNIMNAFNPYILYAIINDKHVDRKRLTVIFIVCLVLCIAEKKKRKEGY